MKKGLTVVILIFIYFFSFNNVSAIEEVNDTSLEKEVLIENINDEQDEEKNIEEEKETDTDTVTYLTELDNIEDGEHKTISKEVDKEIYDKSISGEEFEITYNDIEKYNSFNFSIINNEESQNTIYQVRLDNEKIYEEYFDKIEKKDVRLNITGKSLTICLKGNGTYLNPYLSTENNTYKISYDEEKIYYTEEDKYTIEKEEDKTGYIFKYYENNDGNKYYPNDEVYLYDDLNLKSIYEEEVYTVTYNYFDNEVKNNYTINNNNLFIPEYSGYKFLGWFDVNGNRINELKTGNIVLYAKFEKTGITNLNYINTSVNYSNIDLVQNKPQKEDNTEKDNKAVSIEQIETPFNSKTIKINYGIIIGILVLISSVFLIFKMSVDS